MRTRSLRLFLLGLCLGAPVAFAAGLGDYEPIFSTNPCQDGWAACIVNGDSVTSEPSKDAAGRAAEEAAPETPSIPPTPVAQVASIPPTPFVCR